MDVKNAKDNENLKIEISVQIIKHDEYGKIVEVLIIS